jgi:cytochrome c551
MFKKYILFSIFITAFTAYTIVGFSACQVNTYAQGEILYQQYCGQCHMDDGSGLGTNIPPLANSDYLEKNLQNLPCLIRYGIKEPVVVNGVTYNQVMPGNLNVAGSDMANIINYIGQKWYNKDVTVDLNMVKKELEKCTPAQIIEVQNLKK